MSSLDAETRARLIKLARAAIMADLAGSDQERPEDRPWPPLERRGVFVTLRKGGQLRGCIGTFVPQAGLLETIQSMAVAAAHDPRFVHLPLGAAEMKDIRIEISLLSPLERVKDPLDFEIGRHGIYVQRGSHSGCFLPDVATERGWSKETFLTQCCQQKAGLAPLAWQQPDTEVSIFTVEKIEEQGT